MGLKRVEFIGADGQKTVLVGNDDLVENIRRMVKRDELPEQDSPKVTDVDEKDVPHDPSEVAQHGTTPAERDTTGDKPPAPQAGVEKWQDWMASRGIPFDPNATKEGLRALWESSRQSAPAGN